ncbi:hypothetical protein K435DRAFT_854591 [Dendrothele bispora CBS 962.96]|uniref:Agmatinase n=1 Tax=Dendrothele bispora (strain CBS 962.96) TaxID=1314807 RepID=A0A4S8ME41_DENBC|nr:hypothetical protein K435DRAFT_854591 [Dendrothele bispora CBS 962.96]
MRYTAVRIPTVGHEDVDEETRTSDVAILDFPFDTTTSYRPGARFGPYVIRVESKRLHAGAPDEWWWNLGWLAVPGDDGDAPITPMDNAKALDQMQAACYTLLNDM